jgi:chorismate mutase/prephenate dehydratase
VARLSQDPVIQAYRDQISSIDLKILEALNERIALVKRLKDHKESLGLGFHDADQEARVIRNLRQANRGPLSEEGLLELFRLIMECTKRDAARLGESE